jgi:hypothetical protein
MLEKFQIDETEALTENGIRVFLMHMKEVQGIEWNTVLSFISAFIWWFRMSHLPIPLHSADFREFKSGIRRTLTEHGSCPYRKDPWLVEYWEPAFRWMSCRGQRDFVGMLCLMFFGFLRISEALGLMKGDVDMVDGVLVITIRRFKCDTFGAGERVFIPDNGQAYSPHRFPEIWSRRLDDTPIRTVSSRHPRPRAARMAQRAREYIFPQDEGTYRRRLHLLIDQTGIIKRSAKLSFHSFRRGGAHAASENHVEDAAIKAHGRWKSAAYVIYCFVAQERAGADVCGAL